MADYISTLTGAQMDASLLDMAEHTSEAYAVGERNGVPVGDDDVTYHNNARYYAQQAQSIAPASVTEAVRWDVAQTALTDAQREQGRENIKATSHNPNLFDNAWFNAGNVINSRGIAYNTTINGSKYGIDRWFGVGNGYTLAATGLTIPSGGAAVQKKDWSAYANQTVTISALGSNGTIGTWTGTFATGQFTLSNSMGSGTIVSTSQMNISSVGVEWKAVKLELGSFSTLAYDTPPDYGEELTRCIYSTADPTDTYANNGFGRSNENLIDNPWFSVNQRGFTSGTTGFPADRWLIPAGDATAVWSANGISFQNITTNGRLRQYLPDDKFRLMLGETLTMTLKCQGTYYYVSFTLPSTLPTANTTYLDQYFASSAYRVVFMWQPSYNRMVIDYYSYTNYNKVNAIKLEKGTRSTLCNDTQPNYETELAKCQYYYRVIPLTRYPIAIDGSYAYLTTIGMNMRTTPTASLIATGGVRDAGGQANITSVSVTGFTNNNATVRFALASSRSYVVGYIYDSTLALSADIL